MSNLTNNKKNNLLFRFMKILETGKVGDRLILKTLFFLTLTFGILTIIFLLINNKTDNSLPSGSFSEGIIGSPRFINPVLAFTKTDRDLVKLIYSGLMKIDEKGELVNDLAKNITLSKDGLIYEIELRKDVTFHDNTPITADDVIYTIKLIQNTNLKSPLLGNWTDIKVQKINSHKLSLALPRPYSPFKENLTLGILPAHSWNNLQINQIAFSRLNTEPIGSGPYKIKTISTNPSGLINGYTLEAFNRGYNQPKIKTIQIKFFNNAESLLEGLLNGNVDATAYLTPDKIDAVYKTGKFNIKMSSLPRNFAIFFNQNKSELLRDKNVRKILENLIDKQKIIKNIFSGYAIPSQSPIDNNLNMLNYRSDNDTSNSYKIKLLEENGWTLNDKGVWEKIVDGKPITLTLNLKTEKSELFSALAEEIKRQLEKIGIPISIEKADRITLVESVIRPRNFSALLYGIETGYSNDIYPFWHSSQQDDPGLNISQYANVKVDDLLEKTLLEQDEAKRKKLLTEASDMIMLDTPAIFLFKPTMIYVTNKNIKTTNFARLSHSSDRFYNISNWELDKKENDSLLSSLESK